MGIKNIIKIIAAAIIFIASIAAIYWLSQKNIGNTVIYNTLIAIFVGIVLGFFSHSVLFGPVVELKDATDERKKRLDTEEHFERYTARLEERVQKLSAELLSTNLKLEAEIANSPLDQRKLQERVKHLNCFYGLSKLVNRPNVQLEQILQETTELIRNAYQYPDVTCARITFDGVLYTTDNFSKSELSQGAQIKVRGNKTGTIEIYCLAKQQEGKESPFLKEERDLLDAVAEQLGRIVELKQADERLRLFRDLIDQSNDCIFVVEPKWGRFLDVNDRACVSLGYTREELLDMTAKDIKESTPDDASWTEYTKDVRNKEYLVLEDKHRRKDGTVFPVEINVKFIDQGKKSYMVAVARDITERKQAEEKQAQLIQELKSTNQRVESINQELKDFAYIVSHDLKAPLRGIKNLADWISDDYGDKLGKKGKEQISLLLARVGRMHNLIDGVLEYSRVGRVKEEQVQVNLNELISNVIDMVTPPENIEITVENELPTVTCEKTRITQVFENLLSNAIKYMDKPHGQIKISFDDEDGFWKFGVTDNGPGIEEKHFEKIFQMFQTLSPRDEFESTGVGLTVVKKIVELYGGKIWVESKVGQGSTFFFTLPKQKSEVVDNAELQANIAC